MSFLSSEHKAVFQISFQSDRHLLTENILGFRVRGDLTAGGSADPAALCCLFTFYYDRL